MILESYTLEIIVFILSSSIENSWSYYIRARTIANCYNNHKNRTVSVAEFTQSAYKRLKLVNTGNTKSNSFFSDDNKNCSGMSAKEILKCISLPNKCFKRYISTYNELNQSSGILSVIIFKLRLEVTSGYSLRIIKCIVNNHLSSNFLTISLWFFIKCNLLSLRNINIWSCSKILRWFSMKK